jgi:hypothetical protein
VAGAEVEDAGAGGEAVKQVDHWTCGCKDIHFKITK